MIAVLGKPILYPLVVNRSESMEQIAQHAATLLLVEAGLFIAIGGPPHTVQLVQNAKLFV